jgi:hypothetical protein
MSAWMIKKKNFDCCCFMLKLNCWRYSRNFFSTKNKNESFKMSAPPKFTILLPVRSFSIQTVSSFWRLGCTESGRTVEGDQEVLRALAHFLSGWSVVFVASQRNISREQFLRKAKISNRSFVKLWIYNHSTLIVNKVSRFKCP